MATTVTIKGVESELWRVFKTDAVRHGQTTAEHFTQIVKQHCGALNFDESVKIMSKLRKKSGNWSGSKEITKWRKERAL